LELRIRLTRDPIDTRALLAARPNLPDCGGFVTFEGIVRNNNHSKQVSHLEYEAYESLAIKELTVICQEVHNQFPIKHVQVIHRLGKLQVGDVALFIQCMGVHREEAFRATMSIIDLLKKSVPIWKKETYRDGHSSWIACDHGETRHA
jgi:molybdopterin synthase catalytic subunit